MFTLNPLYMAAVIGAVALLMLLQPRGRGATRRGLRLVAALFGLGAVGVFLAEGLRAIAPDQFGTLLPVAFGAVAVIAAVRLITLSRPVLAALHFVVVVLASAAMFLLLEAEFMAFALIIVYAGAILITYLFVLMLARQSPIEGAEGTFDYDSIPREPLAAVTVGLVLLAAVSGAIVDGRTIRDTLESPEVPRRAIVRGFEELERMPKLLDSMARERFPGSVGVVRDESGRALRISGDGAEATVAMPAPEPPVAWTLGPEALPGNTRLVGMMLVAAFPASLELAGVILLMAMYGAVVLARRQIELGEDERRAAAGLDRLTVDEPERDAAGGAA
jgi:NADH-quinone oxidoreductase subunit J